ncbi:uncharacterized protein G2W53_004477 [Senna tora]|uniref:Uncharacterized protein n=1 Tax=Senna tora TaxID=362788 RepID=A0A834XD92_9FABA|nr:uncharacterized protein G2W53_004477 [Senna tora]
MRWTDRGCVIDTVVGEKDGEREGVQMM